MTDGTSENPPPVNPSGSHPQPPREPPRPPLAQPAAGGAAGLPSEPSPLRAAGPPTQPPPTGAAGPPSESSPIRTGGGPQPPAPAPANPTATGSLPPAGGGQPPAPPGPATTIEPVSPEPPPPPTQLALVRGLRRAGAVYARYSRPVRWLPPLLLGLIIGVAGFGSVQCVIEDRLGTVAAPDPEPPKDFDITLIITNGYLERQVTESLNRSNVFGADRIENVQVRTRNNRVVVTGVVAIVVRPRFEMQLSMRVEDGQIKLRVEETRGPIGGMAGNLPRLLEPVINDRVNRATDGFQARIVTANAPDQGVTVTASLLQPLSPTPAPSPTSQTCICITATATPAR